MAVLTLRREIIVRLMSEENDMTKRMNIPFSPPDISDAEVEEVAKALKSGWITTGPRVKQLEKKIADTLRPYRGTIAFVLILKLAPNSLWSWRW